MGKRLYRIASCAAILGLLGFAGLWLAEPASAKSSIASEVSVYVYNGAVNSVQVRAVVIAPEASDNSHVGSLELTGTSAGLLLTHSSRIVAANTGLPSLAAADLNPAQLANLGRYTSKLPAAAEETVITAGENGVVTFTTRVPGRVPGSYATYAKTVDEAGTTIGYVKTTIAPDGTVVSVKDKLAG